MDVVYKNARKERRLILILFFIFIHSSGCGSGNTNSSVPYDFDLEFVTALAGGATASGAVALNLKNDHNFFAQLMYGFTPFQLAQASSSCPTFSSSLCGGGSSVTLSYNSCTGTGGNPVTLNGGQILNFGSNAQCMSGVPVCGVGNNLVRTFASNSSIIVSPPAGLNVSYEQMSLDTSTLSGYLSPQVNGGFTITGTASGSSIVINGIHILRTYPAGTNLDYTFTTNTILGGSPLVVQVASCGGGARTVASGTVVTEINSPNSTNTTLSTFSNVVWNGTSCFPQSGTISEKNLGSGSTDTLTFNGNGTATTVDSILGTSTISLRYCF